MLARLSQPKRKLEGPDLSHVVVLDQPLDEDLWREGVGESHAPEVGLEGAVLRGRRRCTASLISVLNSLADAKTEIGTEGE